MAEQQGLNFFAGVGDRGYTSQDRTGAYCTPLRAASNYIVAICTISVTIGAVGGGATAGPSGYG